MTVQTRENILKNCQRWVVKIGSALLTDNGRGVDSEAIARWVKQLAELQQQGKEILLVSSGSVAQGVVELGWNKRPDNLHQLQAAAAVGQMGLIHTYQEAFKQFNLQTAQILLTHDDLSNRKRYLNARQTLRALVELGVVPIINENDTVATDEIRFGDNDTLAGMVANLVEADVLVILTDQQGLFDADPRNNPDAKLIETASVNDEVLDQFAKGSKGELGRGGMATKLRAARLAAQSGAHTFIVGGKIHNVLPRLARADSIGSCLQADQPPVNSRKQWLAAQYNVSGVLVLDAGAENALSQGGNSLLPVGVKHIKGEFRRGDLVLCENEQGREIARGLINYNQDDARKLLGKTSDQLNALLGYEGDPELIHCDNLIVL